MRKFIPGSLINTLPVIILCLISCSQGSCFEETESYLKASFYKTDKLTAPDSLTIYGLNMESNKLYDEAKSVQHALIPLNTNTSDCTFIIEINGVTDTLKFEYSSYPHLISKECGYTFYHQLDSIPEYSKNLIKDIKTGNSTITNLNVENIRIYY